MIPKIIHYCWFGPKPYPRVVEKCMDSWKVHLSDYSFKHWNEDNSPMDMPYVKAAYAAKKYAFVSDYVRFWALQKEGGVYLDTDMFVLRSLDNLLNTPCFFAWETEDERMISAGVIGSEKNNTLINNILAYYENRPFIKTDINKLVLPRIITPIYEEYGDQTNISLLPFDYFYPFPYSRREDLKNFIKYATKNTYAIHLWNLSWVSPMVKRVSRIVMFVKRIKTRLSNE